ncbi:MAG: TonB-dependent receptor [Muribaculaceae bacterium]|nr:TonB-dependent receptor [Muribaculaceae bacterium]
MKKKLLCGIIGATVAPALCSAADVESLDSIPGVNLDEVSVVASRATDKSPIAFTNVTSKQLSKVNAGPDLPYLLGMTPSLISTSDAGAGIGYTSMRVRGTDGSRINVTANGVPINNAESHNVYWVNMPDLASSLKDVQVQRGAGTSTNGAAAFGATVNMVTFSPSRDPYAEVSASYGMYNTHKETIRLGTGIIDGHWAADVRLSNIGSDGYIERASTDLWSYLAQVGYYSTGTSVRLLAFGGKEKTYMAWDYASKEDMEKYGRRYNPCGEYTDSEGNTAYYPNQNDNYIQHHFQLLVSQRLSSAFNLDIALHYTKDDGYYEQYKTKRTLSEYGLQPFYNAEGEQIKKSDLVRLKKNDNGFGGGVLSLTYKNDRLNAIFGGGINNFHGLHYGQIAWVRNYVGPIDPLQEDYRNTGDKLDANVYLRADYSLGKYLSIYGDLQYRHIDYRIKGVSDNFDYATDAMAVLDYNNHYNFFNPKAGVTYTYGPHRAFASWSVAHREPVRDNFTDGDPDHKPRAERLFDYELGYRYTKGIVSAEANLYYMDYKDQLVLTGQLSDTGNPLTVNVPRSYRMGVELMFGLQPCKWFDWQLTATLSRNRIKNFVEYIYEDEWTNPISFDLGDTPIAFSPDFTFANAFNFRWNAFDASLQSRYVSSQYMTNARCNEQKLDAYFVSDLFLGYTFRPLYTKEVRIGFTIYNLFNAKYLSNGYAGSGYYVDESGGKVIYRYSGYAAQAPLHVLGSVTVKF